MIIWGTRGLTSTVESRSFHCPQCSMQRGGSLKQVRNFFTLYFIPLIPLNISGRYVECSSCGGTFAEEALNYDPEKEREETNTKLLRVMVMAALADDRVDELELAEIKKQYVELTGFPIPAERLHQEIDFAQKANTTLNKYVRTICSDLSPHGRALVVKLAFHTMSATDAFGPRHQEQLVELSKTLSIPEDQFRALIEHLSEPATEAKP